MPSIFDVVNGNSEENFPLRIPYGRPCANGGTFVSRSIKRLNVYTLKVSLRGFLQTRTIISGTFLISLTKNHVATSEVESSYPLMA